ncbi:MAG: hypothetical protein WA971_08390 [Microbacterium sp.]
MYPEYISPDDIAVGRHPRSVGGTRAIEHTNGGEAEGMWQQMQNTRGRALGKIAALAGMTMVLGACSSGPGASGIDSSREDPGAEEVVCDAVEIGPITRCENFYTDYWPIIEKSMDELYEKAKTTAGGVVNVWDWYEQDPAVVAAFNKKWPDLTIKSQGLTYERSSAIVAARATASETTDVMGGTLTVDKQMFDEGYFADIDWVSYGLPKEFLVGVGKGAFPDSVNGYLLQYNTKAIDPAKVPDSLDALVDGTWPKRSITMADWESQAFSGIGMAQGKDAMTELIDTLKSSETLLLSSDASGLVSSGDVPMALGTWLTVDNPNMAVKAFADSAGFTQNAGVNTDAQNPAGAMIWALWNAYDPDWIEQRLTDPAYASTAVPWLGLPTKTLDSAKGLVATNIAAYTEGLKDDRFVWESLENRDEYVETINAAGDLLSDGGGW